jgi:hypothetical protein
MKRINHLAAGQNSLGLCDSLDAMRPNLPPTFVWTKIVWGGS